MAAITHAVSAASTAAAETYPTGAFTPAAGDLLVVFVLTSGIAADANRLRSSDSLMSFMKTRQHGTGGTKVFTYVSTAFARAISQTVTLDSPGDAGTGCIVSVERISLMTRRGAAAVRQSAIGSGNAGTTPAPAFAVAALTGNPTLGYVANDTNPAGMTEPASTTELVDTGFLTPDSGLEIIGRDSGFTGTTYTWGGTSVGAHTNGVVEMNAAAALTATGQTSQGLLHANLLEISSSTALNFNEALIRAAVTIGGAATRTVNEAAIVIANARTCDGTIDNASSAMAYLMANAGAL